MNCLSEEKLQAYLDGETSLPESEMVEKHLDKCRTCRELFSRIREESLEIKELVSVMKPEHIPAPKLKKPVSRKRILWPLLSGSVAAVLLILLLTNSPAKENCKIPELERLVYELIDEQDANQLWLEQTMLSLIESESGNIIIPLIN